MHTFKALQNTTVMLDKSCMQLFMALRYTILMLGMS